MFSSQEVHLYIGAGLLYHIVSQRGLQQLNFRIIVRKDGKKRR